MASSTRVEAVEQGRAAYAAKAWEVAFEALSRADALQALDGEDLERLAWAAALTGRDEAFVSLLERLHQGAVEAGDVLRGARYAFWMGMRLMMMGEVGRASGWLGRAQRLVEGHGSECAEGGYLLLPVAQRQLAAGALDTADDASARAAAVGERYGDADLVALARSVQGKVRLRQGRLQEGLALLDEAMVAATGDELSPLVTGIVYCSVIACCQQVYAFDRAREWTAALSRWCDAQPELVAFTGSCMVHRAEVMQLGGAWAEAIEQARRASAGADRDAIGEAFYQQGEIHRLRGEHAAAEEAYGKASQAGVEPLPGLALLRLAQGRTEQAAGVLRRALAGIEDTLARVRLLPATVEVMLGAGHIEDARSACAELEVTAHRFESHILEALAAHARGTVALHDGDAQEALAPLRRAFSTWQQLDAPYLAARIRVALARACRALGDEEGASLELRTAREVFAELGAAPDLASVDTLTKAPPAAGHRGLTARELQVLRLVACGKTNKEVAVDLGLSERTVDRHVSNIFTKLDVSTRAAATAHAYQHGLI